MMIRPDRTAFIPALALALIAVAPGVGGSVTAVRAATTHTVVSLTFDDGNEDAYKALPALKSHGMAGTFYTITGYIGVNKGFMTLPQLRALHKAGNEIAGHTVLHPPLTQVSTAEARREICDGRNTLIRWGFPATDFAYPYDAFNPKLERIVKACGYNSARQGGDVGSPSACHAGCPVAETIPPADPYAIRTPSAIEDFWSLADMERPVTQAENGGGGWVVLIFHHICQSGCGIYSITPQHFNALLTWLRTQNVSVETVGQVIGGPVRPAVGAPQARPARPGINGLVNPSLETNDPDNPGTPYCWQTDVSSGDRATFAETRPGHSGPVAETVRMRSNARGFAGLITKQDLGMCAPSALAGHAYLASAWYKSTRPARFQLWYRDANGGWHFWTISPPFAAASTWTRAHWATPTVPAGATALSLGLGIPAKGTLTTDDYSLSARS
jgi:peptidoglycan/xylan/chitin deacetylase (PgdA/CDA1 family)